MHSSIETQKDILCQFHHDDHNVETNDIYFGNAVKSVKLLVYFSMIIFSNAIRNKKDRKKHFFSFFFIQISYFNENLLLL